MQLKERNDLVTMHGKPVVLLGDQVSSGENAPDFMVVDKDFKPVALADFKGKPCVISAVPSLDTPVCSLQTKRFNSEIVNLPQNVVVMTISMDLPFAQKRFCDAEKVDRVLVLSDHVQREFGMRYGLLIKDMGLLARAVFALDGEGKIAYKQLVPELTNEPDYDAALNAARQAAH